MNGPSATASKAEWRTWARTLGPVPVQVAERVSRHVEAFVRSAGGLVLGYQALPDEVPIEVVPDAVARLDVDGGLLLAGTDGPVAPTDVDVVLVPARAFDRDGFRLGRGGGHYDRLLPQLRPGVPVVGVTCTARIVDRLPREPHDVPMTHLADEHGVHPTNSTRQHSESERHFVENEGGAELDS